MDVKNRKVALGTVEVARLAGVHRGTVWTWIKYGVPAPGGERVRLEGRRVGGRWKTTRKLYRRFLDALNGVVAVPGLTPSQESAAALADVEALNRELRGA